MVKHLKTLNFMAKKLVINKGYTLRVTSWENDADHYRTIDYWEPDKEKAKVLVKMCRELFPSRNSRVKGAIGNGDIDERAYDWMKANGQVLIPEDDDINDEDDLHDLVADIAGDLMGYSEWYGVRVCEKVEILYSDTNVYVEELEEID
jgi:hypothetical protein